MATKKAKPTAAEIAQERNRVRAVAQRAVEGSSFLPIHGFLSDKEADRVARRVVKYILKNKLILVDKGFKDYLVLFPEARVYPKWKLLCGIRTK